MKAEEELEAAMVGVDDRFSVVEAVASGSTEVVVATEDTVLALIDPVALALSLAVEDLTIVPIVVVAQSSHVVASTLLLTHSAAELVKLSKYVRCAFTKSPWAQIGSEATQ